ncbi:MAG: hypothetical protein H0X12_18200 [Nocardioides sp.]|nr:hypothetical protein [Nocardioides sp.]
MKKYARVRRELFRRTNLLSSCSGDACREDFGPLRRRHSIGITETGRSSPGGISVMSHAPGRGQASDQASR